MSNFWLSSKKNASDVEPRALLIEVCNASPREIALMAMNDNGSRQEDCITL